MSEQTAPKKRGRKKGSKTKPHSGIKRAPRNLENLTFEQLQDLSIRITELMKIKKDDQIKLLRQKLADLEKL